MDNFRSTDVLCGRGKKFFDHEGNQNLRATVKLLKPEYDTLDKKGKRSIQLQVFDKVIGKFIKLENNKWIEISQKRALEKIAQHFRSIAKDTSLSDTKTPSELNVARSSDILTHLTQVIDNAETSCKTSTDVIDFVKTYVAGSGNILTQVNEFIDNAEKSSETGTGTDVIKGIKTLLESSKRHHDHKTNLENLEDDSIIKNKNKANVEYESNRLYEAYSSIAPSPITSASNSNDQLIPKVNKTEQGKQDLPCLGRFSRRFYYDFDAKNVCSWKELEGRILPDNIHRFHIIEAYAFNCHKIHQLDAVNDKTNSQKKVYKCHSCAWYTTVDRLKNGGWQVRSASHRLSKKKCTSTCLCSSTQKEKLSDQLFFDCLFVREIVYSCYDEAPAHIDGKVKQHCHGMNLPISQLPAERTRYKVYSQLQVIYIEQRLKRQYEQLPQRLNEIGKQNPQLSLTLQKDSLGRFYRCFLGFPIGLPEHLENFSYPVMFIDCSHY